MLIVVFGGDTHSLMPLYMIGVFISFTLSQAGMVSTGGAARCRVEDQRPDQRLRRRRHRHRADHRRRHQGARRRLDRPPADSDDRRASSTITQRHYDQVAAELTLQGWDPAARTAHRAGADQRHSSRRGEGAAIRQTLSTDVRAVYVDVDPAETEQLRREWDGVGRRAWRSSCWQSPFRSLMEPLLDYIEQVARASDPDDYVTVILPEFVPARWWHHLLHNQRALLIKGALLFKPNWS